MRTRWLPGAALFLSAAIIIVYGCNSGSSSPSLTPNIQANSLPQSAATSIPVSDVGAAIALPPVAGYNESITLTTNTAPAGTVLKLTVSTGVPKGVPAIPAGFKETQEFLHFAISSSQSVTLNGFPGFSLTLPPGLRWDGGDLHLGFYDPAKGWQEIGDVTLVDRTMTFAPTRNALTLKAGTNYVVAPFACVGPSPTPTTASTTVPLDTSTALPIPALGGFSGNWAAAANNAPAGTSVLVTTFLSAPAGAPSPVAALRTMSVPLLGKPPVNSVLWVTSKYSAPGAAIAASSAGFTFDSFPAVSITLPVGFNTSGVTFKLETFDLTTGALLDTESAESSTASVAKPNIVRGGIVESFPGTNSPFAIVMAHTYIWELVTQAIPSPTPSPTIAPSPSPSPSVAPSPSASVGTITEYVIPSPVGTANDITTGPDGNLWFTSINANVITKVTTAGTFTRYSGPTGNGGTNHIAVGSDGNLWFTDSQTATIGKITTSGAVSTYTVCGGAGGAASGITKGPDGNIWFTDSDALGSTCDDIGKITSTGSVSEYSSGSSFPHVLVGVTAGPDGNLWYVYNGSGPEAGAFCKMSTSGTIVACYALTGTGASALTAGPDGNLWFTNGFNAVCKDTATGGTITCYPTPTTFTDPQGIAVGPDGNLWFTEPVANNIGRVTTSGAITEYALPTGSTGPKYITEGPDGNMWFTETGKIGKIVP